MILVTGATGLLGSHLVYRLLKQNEKVRATYRHNSDRESVRRTIEYYENDTEPLLEHLEWIEADLTDVVALGEAFKGIKKVYHCAAIVSFDPKDARKLLHLNPLITGNVVNAALEEGVDKMVHVSSVAALGRKVEGEYIDESAEWISAKNNSVYALSKYRAELEIWRGIQEGLNAVIVNPCIILGPGRWEEGSSAIFGKIAKGFRFYTEGVNAYVDVRDVAEIMVKLMESPVSGERFVVAAENISYKDIFEKMAASLGVKAPSVKVSPFLAGIVWRLEKLRTSLTGSKPVITKETARTAQKIYYYDNSRIRKKLSFEFRPIDETIGDMASFYWRDKKN